MLTTFGSVSTAYVSSAATSQGLIGAIQVLRNADGGGGGGVIFSGKKRYEGVMFNVISVTRGWVGVQFPGKKRYVTLEWPHTVTNGGVSVCVPSGRVQPSCILCT